MPHEPYKRADAEGLRRNRKANRHTVKQTFCFSSARERKRRGLIYFDTGQLGVRGPSTVNQSRSGGNSLAAPGRTALYSFR